MPAWSGASFVRMELEGLEMLGVVGCFVVHTTPIMHYRGAALVVVGCFVVVELGVVVVARAEVAVAHTVVVVVFVVVVD